MAGIDLDAHHEDVRRIAAAIHGRAVVRAGFTFEEFYQNLCLAILRRNGMASAWDPRRASMSRYVVVLGRTVLNHMSVKAWRRNRRHQLGAISRSGEHVDAALVAKALEAPLEAESLEMKARELLTASLVMKRIEKAARLVLLGHKNGEAAEAIQAPREVVAWLRAEMKDAIQGLK
jgi:hypothetical protein